jgi:signal transduction histidine kinase
MRRRRVNAMQERLSDMLAERTAMIGAIAHDLRTPLSRIAFRVEGAPDPVRDAVLGDIEQMRAMIASTIAFVKRGSGQLNDMRRVELSRVLAGIAADAKSHGPRRRVRGRRRLDDRRRACARAAVPESSSTMR